MECLLRPTLTTIIATIPYVTKKIRAYFHVALNSQTRLVQCKWQLKVVHFEPTNDPPDDLSYEGNASWIDEEYFKITKDNQPTKNHLISGMGSGTTSMIPLMYLAPENNYGYCNSDGQLFIKLDMEIIKYIRK